MNLLITMRQRLPVRLENKLRSKVKLLPAVMVLAAAAFLRVAAPPLLAAEDDGLALAIVYDTSGSMQEPVRSSSGHLSPKYVIANHALLAIAAQIQHFATNTADGPPRTVYAGLFTFDGDHAKSVVDFGPFDGAAIEKWATNFSHPNGGTPLGNALRTASRAVLDCPLPHKHVLIITDGINTLGPAPAAVMPALQREATRKQMDLAVHFVAFDVSAQVFDGVKRLGATVVAAADETQLDSQLDFILQNQILLEKPETPKSK